MNMTDNSFAFAWLAVAQTEAGQAQPEAPAATSAPRVPGSVGSQGAPPATSPPPGGAQGAPGGGFNFIWILMLFLVMMVVMTSMTGRREKKRREALMTSLKKGDRVQTLGGIIGTIIEMYDNEVVLRVDEVSNTRIRFAKTAVQGVLREARAGGGGSEVEPKLKSQTAAV